MEDIGPLTNQRKIDTMHEDFQKAFEKENNPDVAMNDQSSGNPSQSSDFFDNSQVPSSFNTLIGNNPMQHQNSGNLSNVPKRKLKHLNAQDSKKQRQQVEYSLARQSEALEIDELNITNSNDLPQATLSEKSPPINATLQSQGRKSTIIIKPVESDAANLVNNPFEITSVLENSLFNNLRTKDVRVNKKKNLIIVEAEEYNMELFEDLVKIDQLGKWRVKCYIPSSDRFKVGVISPVSCDVELGMIKENLKRQYNVHDVCRLNKKKDTGEWIPSLSSKITFAEEQLPSDIKIGYSFYKVRPYVSEPLQCYRCQRLGHTATGCRAKVRCLLCGGEHPKEQCSFRQEKCANCAGAHRANSKQCNIFMMACQIEKEKAINKESHEVARKKVINVNRMSNRGRINYNSANNSGRTYAPNVVTVTQLIDPKAGSCSGCMTAVEDRQTIADPNFNQTFTKAVKRNQEIGDIEFLTQNGSRQSNTMRLDNTVRLGNAVRLDNAVRPECKEAATQTEKWEQCKVTSDKQFYINLKDFLLELFQLKFAEENIGAQALLIECAMRNHFNINITENATTSGLCVYTSNFISPNLLFKLLQLSSINVKFMGLVVP